jgi:integrase
MIAVGSIFENARGREKWIKTNPTADIERIKLPRRSGDFKALTIEEAFAVAEATRSDQDRTLILTAAFTGLRMGELRALRWEDVRFTEDLILVRRNLPHGNRIEDMKVPKSGKVRSIPLIEQAAVPLAKLSMRDNFTGPQDLIFCTPTGTPVDDSPLRTMFYDALTDAGLGRLRDKDRGEPIVFHDLRHTFGTLGARYWPLADLQAYMGHANIETTMIYVHHTPRTGAARELSSAVAEVMGQGAPEANRVPNRVPN